MTDDMRRNGNHDHYSDHDLLIRLDERTLSIEATIKAMAKENSERISKMEIRLDDLETKRIQPLEAWKQNMMGRLTVIVTIAAFVASFLAQFILRDIHL